MDATNSGISNAYYEEATLIFYHCYDLVTYLENLLVGLGLGLGGNPLLLTRLCKDGEKHC